MLPQVGLRDQFLHHHIDHGPRGEGKDPGHHQGDAARHQYSEQAEDGLYHAGQGARSEGPAGAHAVGPEGEGDGGLLKWTSSKSK